MDESVPYYHVHLRDIMPDADAVFMTQMLTLNYASIDDERLNPMIRRQAALHLKLLEQVISGLAVSKLEHSDPDQVL